MILNNGIRQRRLCLCRLLSLILLVSLLLTTSCHVPLSRTASPAAPISDWVSRLGILVVRSLPGVLQTKSVSQESIHALQILRQSGFPLDFDEVAVPAEENAVNPGSPLRVLAEAAAPTTGPDTGTEHPGAVEAPAVSESPTSGPAVSVSPVPQPLAPTVNRSVPIRVIDPGKPMVALTFDDGPKIRTTLPILDTLLAYQSAATFFVVGIQVADNQVALVRMAAEGHEIGNHTFSHVELAGMLPEDQSAELERNQSAVASVIGMPPRLVRPTFGSYDQALRTNVQMPLILWSVDTLDWKYRDPARIVAAVLDSVRDGDIILMHDIYDSTVQALQTLVPELISRGYQLVTVSELAAARGIGLEPGKIFANARH